MPAYVLVVEMVEPGSELWLYNVQYCVLFKQETRFSFLVKLVATPNGASLDGTKQIKNDSYKFGTYQNIVSIPFVQYVAVTIPLAHRDARAA